MRSQEWAVANRRPAASRARGLASVLGPAWAAVGLLAAAAMAHAAAPPIPSGSLYVAMGSSFAAGPGVAPSADVPQTRCQRSAENYAHQLARKRGLRLVDVSCGGATTAHVLGPWRELPPQIEAVTPEARLVTVTIGGNDLNYIGGLMAGSCGAAAERPPICGYIAKDAQAAARLTAPPSAEAWTQVETGLERIAAEVRRRAPAARLVFVDYFTVLPADGLCPQTPLSEAAAAQARATAERLRQLTAVVAARSGAEVVRVSDLSRGHDACAAAPWVTGATAPGHVTGFVPYHPNLAGMTAAAEALDRALGR